MPASRQDVLRTALACACLRLASSFSLRSLQRAGATLAPLVPLVSKRVRRSVRTNLALCFPELDEAERRRLARRSLAQGMSTALELGPLWCWDPRRILALVSEVEGLDLLESARSSGRGVLILGPHLGAWEVVSVYLCSGGPLTSLYREPRVQGLGAFLRQARERSGARLVPAGAAGVGALYRALRRGEAVGLLPDQDPGPGAGVWAPFFGVPAHTGTLAARLLGRTGSVPLLAWAERLERGRGYRLHFQALDTAELASQDGDRAACALNRALERVIRRRPEQYLWSYRRFRHQPAGRNPYRVEASCAELRTAALARSTLTEVR